MFDRSWSARLRQTGDLEGGYRELTNTDDFFEEALRGRLASLLLRTRLADKHFRRSAQLGADAAATTQNICRAVILHSYHCENSLLLCSASDLVFEDFPAELDAVFRVDKAYRKVQRAMILHRAVLATMALYRGDVEEALYMYESCLSAWDGPAELSGSAHAGLACCYHNLAREEERDRSLETAALAQSAITDDKLNSVSLAAKLQAINAVLEREGEARKWGDTVSGSGVPDNSARAFMARATLTIERCTEERRLLIL